MKLTRQRTEKVTAEQYRGVDGLPEGAMVVIVEQGREPHTNLVPSVWNDCSHRLLRPGDWIVRGPGDALRVMDGEQIEKFAGGLVEEGMRKAVTR